jgi:AraC-like DNA-binding protein
MKNPTFVRLCRARDRLRESEEAAMSVRAVAREAGLSPYHFIRLFERLFGETPHQYRINARLDRARALLASSDWSVTEICMELGCSSMGSFSDLFARRVGVPPSVYRRQMRSMMAVPGAASTVLSPGCLSLMAAALATFEKHRPPLRVRL